MYYSCNCSNPIYDFPVLVYGSQLFILSEIIIIVPSTSAAHEDVIDNIQYYLALKNYLHQLLH